MTDRGAAKQRLLDRPAVTALVGVLIGAVLGGALNVIQFEYQAWRTQQRWSTALLAHARVCCQEAGRRKLFLESAGAKPLHQRTGLIASCFGLDLSAWDASLPHLAQLPSEQLDRLILFHDYARRLNLKLQIIEENQLAYAHLTEGKRAKAESIIKQEETVAAFMCTQLEKYADIRALQQLPLQWPDPP
jgi:hypothetical protein